VKEYLEIVAAIPKESIAYVDETGITEYLHRQYCRAKRGVKIIGKVSGKKFKSVGILAAQIKSVGILAAQIKSVGILAAQMNNKIIAPLQYDGTMGSSFFETWFEKYLLLALPKDTTVIMDNASFHRKNKLILLAQKHGCRIIFLPPYSPELNDIENFWSWLKNRLRKILPDFACLDDAISDCFQVE